MSNGPLLQKLKNADSLIKGETNATLLDYVWNGTGDKITDNIIADPSRHPVDCSLRTTNISNYIRPRMESRYSDLMEFREYIADTTKLEAGQKQGILDRIDRAIENYSNTADLVIGFNSFLLAAEKRTNYPTVNINGENKMLLSSNQYLDEIKAIESKNKQYGQAIIGLAQSLGYKGSLNLALNQPVNELEQIKNDFQNTVESLYAENTSEIIFDSPKRNQPQRFA